MRIHPALPPAIATLLLAASAHGQVLQGLQQPLNTIGGAVSGIADPALAPVMDRAGAVMGNVKRLASERVSRLNRLVRSNRGMLEFDDHGDPAVRGEIIGVDIPPAAIEAARHAGFTVVNQDKIEGLEIATVTLTAPEGMPLAPALKRIRAVAPGDWAANQLHFESGAAPLSGSDGVANGAAPNARIGIIDGGVGRHATLAGPVEQRGFARGAPAASAHGTAIASLIAGQGAIRGVTPDAALLVGDVYGDDPAGGNALAIARAVGWLSGRGIRVVNISLVGPANPLLGKVIAAAQAKGIAIVAPVGNDGPAAPPAYPASYPGVIAVTGVDGLNHALIEAGRALHLDYAAPGADMLGAKAGGGTMRLRGTSYAAPLVAARLGAQPSPSTSALDREAIDLGEKGADKIYGRGLICGKCRN